MPFLILTRAGFEDLKPLAGFHGASLYVNPTLLSPQEISQLQDAGAEVCILPATVDPHSDRGVQQAIRFAEEHGGNPVWAEHASRPAPSGQQHNGGTSLAHKMLHHKVAKNATGLAGAVLRHARKRAFSKKPLLIIPYLGYGNRYRLAVRGRVLADEGFRPQTPDDSGWRNLVELYKRLESDQVAGARVRARFRDVEQEAVTDGGGYFLLELVLNAPLASTGWHAIELDLVDPLAAGGKPVRASADVLVPPSAARFGVISDIDDTILWTNVGNRLNMMLTLARANAHTRKPFKGVAAFYRALHEGISGNEDNPLFYVSSSPWHLFSPLVEFMRVQDIPIGPVMLKELSIRKVFGSNRHYNHKLDKIEAILDFYPDLQFILIGDSGEKDPEIYAEIVKRHPRSVRAIYIRNVNPDPSRIEALDRLIDEVRTSGTQLILAPDSEFAAAHAAAEGLIRAAEMKAVRSDKQEDEAGAGTETGADAGVQD